MPDEETAAYTWVDDLTLDVDGVRFTARETDRFPSQRNDFCLVKRRELTQAYLDRGGPA